VAAEGDFVIEVEDGGGDVVVSAGGTVNGRCSTVSEARAVFGQKAVDA
jgi:hypothetical protein